MVTKQSRKLVAAETLIPRYQNELNFLVGKITFQHSLIESQNTKIEKYQNELNFLFKQLTLKNTNLTKSEVLVKGYSKEVLYMVDQFSKSAKMHEQKLDDSKPAPSNAKVVESVADKQVQEIRYQKELNFLLG